MSSVPLSMLPQLPGMSFSTPKPVINTPPKPTPTAVISKLRAENSQGVRDKKATIAIFQNSNPPTLICVINQKQNSFNFDSSLKVQLISDCVVQIGDIKIYWKNNTDAIKFALTLLSYLSNKGDLTYNLKPGDPELPLEEDDDYELEVSQWSISKNHLNPPETTNLYKRTTLPSSLEQSITSMNKDTIRVIFKSSKKSILFLHMIEIHPPKRRVPTSRIYSRLRMLEVNAQRLVTLAENIARRKKLCVALTALKERANLLDDQLDINAIKIEILKNKQDEITKSLEETSRLMKRVEIDDNLQATSEANERSNFMEILQESERNGDEIRLRALGKVGSEKALTKCMAEMYEAVCCILNEDNDKSYDQKLEAARLQIAETVFL